MSQMGDSEVDNLIVGAGPAGLQLAYCFQQAGREYKVLERASTAGAFFERHPRHRKLLSINKIHNHYDEPDFNLRHDWNSLLSEGGGPLFKEFSSELFPSADDLTRYLQAFAERHRLDIQYGTSVKHISRDGSILAVDVESEEVGKNTLRAKRVFLATGAVRENVPQDIEGIELADSYDSHELDAAAYQNQRVAIIGAGNSAFEVADHLAGSAGIIHVLVKQPVKHAWQTHFPGDLRAVNNNILDMYQLKSLHATLGFRPQRIVRRPDGSLRVSMVEDCPHWSTPSTIHVDLDYDKVIYCTGWSYVPNELFDAEHQPELTPCGRYPRLSTQWETSIPGLYCIGTSMAARDKRAASSFIHGFRYNVRSLFRLIEEECYGKVIAKELSQLDCEQSLQTVASHVIERVSTSSGLYQMNAVLADFIVSDKNGARYYEELPIELAKERQDFLDADFVVSVSLEYGFDKYPSTQRSIDFIHPSDIYRQECSAFLHPVLRLWERGELTREEHFGESLTIRYDRFFSPDAFVEGFDKVFRQRNENRVVNFLNEKLGIFEGLRQEERFSEAVGGGAFRPWTDAEIRAYKEQQVSQRDAPCKA